MTASLMPATRSWTEHSKRRDSKPRTASQTRWEHAATPRPNPHSIQEAKGSDSRRKPRSTDAVFPWVSFSVRRPIQYIETSMCKSLCLERGQDRALRRPTTQLVHRISLPVRQSEARAPTYFGFGSVDATTASRQHARCTTLYSSICVIDSDRYSFHTMSKAGLYPDPRMSDLCRRLRATLSDQVSGRRSWSHEQDKALTFYTATT